LPAAPELAADSGNKDQRKCGHSRYYQRGPALARGDGEASRAAVVRGWSLRNICLLVRLPSK
jgi:hypothetical protein